jgi:DNA-binding PadR family transcriptional regulator
VAQEVQGVVKPPKGMMLAVMRAIAVLGNNAHSFEIRDYISSIMNSDIPTAHIYVNLSRLENMGLVRSESQSSSRPARRGRPRSIYRLTSRGIEALEVGVRLYTSPANLDRGSANGADNEEKPATAKMG